MGEQQQVLGELADAGVTAAVRWAYVSATTRSLELYNEADGLDVAWLGITRFTLFRDRLDRVFHCGRYRVVEGSGKPDFDLLDALSEQDKRSLPRLDAGVVVRSNLNGSPGWALGGLRLLLASGEYGGLDRLPWPQKSETKRRVASRPHGESSQPSLFDSFAPEEIGGLESLLTGPDGGDLANYVVAHSLDPVRGRYELIVGLPRLNSGGGQAWHWRESLLDTPPTGERLQREEPAAPGDPGTVPDAPVRLRRAADRRAERASGQQ